ncbi:cell division protein DivIVA [Weissella oryzae SG25]|uniref:Cell division protein DivIVA n=1 Tax=Weissella oryzae (strain DSM 25784 / JCM 18191 / LMG 30913 / SG25) TaxID=1329250 RepID=A0A069D160_WEIOS|nr:cell division regulator GpsB [Weissella oryzae]GAK31096.1 cell division protein DivIVA [Weissella oryzae SG25]
MENVLHTREEILSKEFKKTRIGTGYDMADVDAFLDEIIADYQAYQNNLTELQTKADQLEAQVADLTKQVSAANLTQAKPAATSSINTNMDILKRLSNLERRVFGSQTDAFSTNGQESSTQNV